MVIGRKTMFIRTAGCDYSCDWCDSKFTWDGTEKHNIKMMTPDEIFEELFRTSPLKNDKYSFNHVTISGGNPALIGKPMGDLIDLLHNFGLKVGLETQGSKWKDWMYQIDDLTISPKPPSSLMTTDFEVLGDIVEKLLDDSANCMTDPNFTFKVVVFDDKDFEYAKKVHQRYPDIPFYLSVGNIDPYEDGEIAGRLLEKLGWLWDKVLADEDMNDALPLPQLHTLVYANRRKV